MFRLFVLGAICGSNDSEKVTKAIQKIMNWEYHKHEVLRPMNYRSSLPRGPCTTSHPGRSRHQSHRKHTHIIRRPSTYCCKPLHKVCLTCFPVLVAMNRLLLLAKAKGLAVQSRNRYRPRQRSEG